LKITQPQLEEARIQVATFDMLDQFVNAGFQAEHEGSKMQSYIIGLLRNVAENKFSSAGVVSSEIADKLLTWNEDTYQKWITQLQRVRQRGQVAEGMAHGLVSGRQFDDVREAIACLGTPAVMAKCLKLPDELLQRWRDDIKQKHAVFDAKFGHQFKRLERDVRRRRKADLRDVLRAAADIFMRRVVGCVGRLHIQCISCMRGQMAACTTR